MKAQSSAVNKAYNIILNKILSFELLPGEVISDFQLAQQLKMSRTPVREAIMWLKMDGLVEPGETKLVVSKITPDDIREICEVREAIESKAVSLILNKGGLTPSQLEKLNSFNSAMSVFQRDFVRNCDLDDQFHNTLVSYSGNSRLVEFSEKMHMQIIRTRWLTVLNPKFDKSKEEHQEIINALTEGNEARAIKAVNTHLANATKNFHEALYDQNLSELIRNLANASLIFSS